MPLRIPMYQQQTLPQGDAMGRAQSPDLTLAPGSAMANFGQGLAEAQARSMAREDVIEFARDEREFLEETQAELRRVSTEEDISRRDVADKYRGWANERFQARIQNHRGSADSRARLQARLEGHRYSLVAESARMQGQAQERLLDDTFKDNLSKRVGQVYANPGSLAALFQELDNDIATLGPAMTPERESTARRTGRAAIAKGAIDSLLGSADFEGAEQALTMPGVGEVIGEDAQKSIRQSITREKNKLRDARMSGIVEGTAIRSKLRTILGREPSDLEVAQSAGVAPKESTMFGNSVDGRALSIMTELAPAYSQGLLPERDKRMFEAAVTEYTQPKMYMNPDTGLPETRRPELPAFVSEAMRRTGQNPAQAWMQGRTPEEVAAIQQVQAALGTGRGATVNVAGPGGQAFDQSRVVPPGSGNGGGAAPQRRAGDQAQPAGGPVAASAVVGGGQEQRGGGERRQQQPQTAWGLASLTTGPVPAAAEAIGRTPGVGSVVRTPQFTQARNFVPQLQRDLVRVLQNNPKYAEGERKAIEQEVNIEPAIFDTPQAYRDRLVGIDNALAVRERNAEETSISNKVGRDERIQAMNVLNALKQFRQNLGVPVRVRNDGDWAALPPGAEYIDPEGNMRTKR